MSAAKLSIVAALAKVLAAAAKKRVDANKCPECGKDWAIGHITFFGYRVADICRFCSYTAEVDMGVKQKT